MYCGDDTGAIIGDIGTLTSKFGYAGEESPKAAITSLVGMSHKSSNKYVGDTSIRLPLPGYDLQNPLTNGLISNWDAVEAIWSHAFSNTFHLNVNEPINFPVMAADSCFSSNTTREKYFEMMFEKFQVHSCYLAKRAMLSSFSVGKSTSIVVDAGADSISVVPVQDGFVLSKAMKTSKLAGNMLDEILADILEKKGYVLKTHYQLQRERGMINGPVVPAFEKFMRKELIRDIKESCVNIIWDSSKPLVVSKYILPDGTEMELSSEAQDVGAILMDNEHMKDEGHLPLGDIIQTSIDSCDVELRRTLLGTIVSVGGLSTMPGYRVRLGNELQVRYPEHLTSRVKVISPGKVEQKFSVFIGGSILASLGSFQQMWKSKKEYDESGAAHLLNSVN